MPVSQCYTLYHIQDELASVQDALTVTETEETWESIGKALNRFAALCNGNATNYSTELVAALRASSRPIGSALNSERTRLSGTATEFITTAVTALGSSFEPLIPHYFPTLLTLCTRANKVFITRAKAAIAAFIEHTHAPMIIHYAADSVKDKSVTLRLAAAETLMLCMKTFNPPDLEKEARAREIEAVIRSTAVDASADVRKMGRKIFDAYKILLPGRLHRYVRSLSMSAAMMLILLEPASLTHSPRGHASILTSRSPMLLPLHRSRNHHPAQRRSNPPALPKARPVQWPLHIHHIPHPPPLHNVRRHTYGLCPHPKPLPLRRLRNAHYAPPLLKQSLTTTHLGELHEKSHGG